MKERTELPFLEAFVRFIKARNCVEIGVAKGQAAVHLCRAIVPEGYYYGFDSWRTYGLGKEFKQLGSKDTVEAKLRGEGFSQFKLTEIDSIRERSRMEGLLDQWCPNGIDFAFIDGDHSYLGIYNDFCIVYPRLSPKGAIAFHDTCTIDGCREFLLDLRTKYYDGTFDIMELPYGNGGSRNPGVSILVKRHHALEEFPIDEVNGSLSDPHVIEERELLWLKQEHRDVEFPVILPTDLHISRLGRYPNRRKLEVLP